MATAYAVAAGRGRLGSLQVGAAVLAGQLSVGWSNDHLDRRRDQLSGRADKPVVTGALDDRLLAGSAAAAVVASVPLSLLSGRRAAADHLVGIAAAWGYSAGLKSTPVSVAPYALAFGLLPGLVTRGLPEAPAPPLRLALAMALLGSGAHFANVIPDLAADAATGVRGLPHRLGDTGSQAAAAALVAAASVVLLSGSRLPRPVLVAVLTGEAGVLLGARRHARRHPDSRWPFRATIVVAAADVLLAVADGTDLR